GEKLAPGRFIVAELAEHAAGHGLHVRLVDATRRHAFMDRFEHDGHAARLQHLGERVRDLRGHLLLNLQPLAVNLDDAGQLADADDAVGRDVGHMRLADDGRDVMLAMGFEADVAQDDHLVITFDLLEGARQHVRRILIVSGEPVLPGANHTARRVEEAVPVGIVSGPSEQSPDGGLRLLAARTFDLARRLHMSALQVEGRCGTQGTVPFVWRRRLQSAGWMWARSPDDQRLRPRASRGGRSMYRAADMRTVERKSRYRHFELIPS